MDKHSFTRLAIAGIMAGGLTMTGCEHNTSSNTETATGGITAAKTLAEFQAECAKMGGTFMAHDCAGMNECKGHSYEEGKGVATHDCQGKSSCHGGSCQEA